MKYRPYVLLLAFLLSLLTGVTQVQPGERAVIWRFGRVLDDKPRPGLYIGLPWGIDRVERVPIEMVRRVTVGYDQRQADEDALTMPTGQLLTGDHNLVNIQVVLDYSVVEDEVEQFVVHQQQTDALINRAAETLLAEWVAGRTVDEVLLQGKRILPRFLVQKTQERIAAYQLGIRIQDAYITHLYPPEDVKSAFDEVTRAQTEVQTRILIAEQKAKSSWRDAEAAKYRIDSQVAAYQREQALLAAAEVENFTRRLAAYQEVQRRDPAIAGGQYLNALWWDEMSRLYARMRETGRIDVLDNYLSGDGLSITQVPTTFPKRK